MHVVACSRVGWSGLAPFARPVSSRYDGFTLHHVDVPKAASLLGAPLVSRLARALRPDIVMERYYNFAGAGLLAARQLRLPAILEVNALIIDPPEVLKRRLDDWLGGPMRHWAVAQCQMAEAIVTPLHTTVPPEISRDKIIELPWGANVEQFDSAGQAGADRGQGITSSDLPTVVFLGSFRAWHGVMDFMHAAELLLQGGRQVRFVLIGDGPERAAAEQLAQHWQDHFVFTGAVAYEAVPQLLAKATVGVAPFNTAPHPALRAAGFFWSPLKVYEYMAAGLPVVTTNIHPLNEVIRDGQEGLLFTEGDVAAIARSIARLLDAPDLAALMGQRARARVTSYYSWEQHCIELEQIAEMLLRSRSYTSSKIIAE
jgi:glycosyltransferase involved in cell wall biosynthesis